MKFSALNVDFNGPSLYLLSLRKPAPEGIKKQYLLRVVILPLFASLTCKRLQVGTTSTRDEFFSRINIDDSERL